MKAYLFESVKELNDYLKVRKGWRKPTIKYGFQVMNTNFEKGNKVFEIVDRILLIEK